MERFFSIEGGDGSGKGTQTEELRRYVSQALAINVLKLSFPRYGHPSAYYAENYLNGKYGGVDDVHPELGIMPYAIDRFAAKSEISDHLQLPSSIVLSDRYMASNLAHQGAKIDDSTERRLFYERTLALEYDILGIPKPSKNIVLLVPTALAQENVDKKAARSYTEHQRDIHEADASHLEKAKRNYIELCDLYPDEFTSINCVTDSGKMRSIEDIQLEIRDRLSL